MGGTPATSFLLLTIVLLALTAWVVVSRFTRNLESNWPLVYYMVVVAHLKAFEGGLNPYVVYMAVLCGLFLRFEFMGGAVLKFFRVIELGTLTYVAWRCLSLLTGP